MLPEWAPSIHPLIIHFPIVLLVLAPAVEALGMISQRLRIEQHAVVGLYVLGALAAAAAYISGDLGAEGLALPKAAEAVFLEHADWAGWTVWFYGLYGLARMVVVWHKPIAARVPGWLPLAVGLGGVVLLFETGDHGAQLVYQYGVGVQSGDGHGMEAHNHADHD